MEGTPKLEVVLISPATTSRYVDQPGLVGKAIAGFLETLDRP